MFKVSSMKMCFKTMSQLDFYTLDHYVALKLKAIGSHYNADYESIKSYKVVKILRLDK